MATYKISGLTLYTSYYMTPIPLRQFDWSCIDDNYDGAPDAGPQLHGRGATELEALFDYLIQHAEKYEEY